jgi:hypothetical protein
MARSTRLQRFNQNIEVMLDRSLSPEARQRMIATRAREALREAQEINGRILGTVPTHATFVDGRQNGQLESVNPDHGTIAFRFEIANRAVDHVWEMLIQTAPVQTGRFRDSIVLFADGEKVETPDERRQAKEWLFLPSVAYARKIETAEGVFEGVAALARSRFGNIADIRFTYRDLQDPGSHLENWAAQTALRPRRGRKGAETGWLRRQPAIQITLR